MSPGSRVSNSRETIEIVGHDLSDFRVCPAGQQQSHIKLLGSFKLAEIFDMLEKISIGVLV